MVRVFSSAHPQTPGIGTLFHSVNPLALRRKDKNAIANYLQEGY
jgi:hypothetical protein